MTTENGPFVQAACFCENVIEDKTGVLSLIRIIDKITRTVAGTDPPDDMPPINYDMKLALMLKSGSARGRGNIRIKIEEPSGLSVDGPSISVHLEGENSGANLITQLSIDFSQEGVYWFWIYFDDTLLSKIPFQVMYSRIIT
ncbi:MAG: hypothetical protein ACE5FD_02490 [Anaerolineae bacterium]